MTATVIPFPSKSIREAVLEARKDAGSAPVHEAAGWMAILPRTGER
jgi:hypothetical protein